MEYATAFAIILILLFLSAFFSGGELAMMALNPLNLETAVRRGDKLAALQQYLRTRPQRFLATILIGNNVVNISLATYSAALAHNYLAPHPRISEELALALSAILMTVLVLIFGELIPKTIAAINTEMFAGWVTYPLYICYIIFTPLNWAIDRLIMPAIYRITGRQDSQGATLGREELATAMAMAYARGELHRHDARMAREAISLSTRDLADVMTPRVDLVAIQEDASAEEAIRLMLDSGFSRLPVYLSDFDEITGMLLLKDLIRPTLREGTSLNDLAAGSIARRIIHMPQTKSVVEALSEMQRKRYQMAVVVDEHGGTAGIVTLEDILEELVGDILDESDAGAHADVIRREEGMAIVSGRARIEQLPELERLDAETVEAGSVGGLLMELLGRPAVVGDSVEIAGMKLTAVKVLQNRIKLVRIERADEPAGLSSVASGS